MSFRSLLLVFGIVCGAAACGSSGAHDSDMQVAPDLQSSPDLPIINDGRPCTTDADCEAASLLCNYAIADSCHAVGRCRPVHVPTCANITYACGCDGKPVDNSSCFYDSGFAGGPVEPGSHYPADCPVDGGP